MSAVEERQIIELVAQALNVPAAGINLSTTPGDVEGWDSVQHLNLVLALEQALAIQFTPEEMERMQSVGEIVAVVKAKSP